MNILVTSLVGMIKCLIEAMDMREEGEIKGGKEGGKERLFFFSRYRK